MAWTQVTAGQYWVINSQLKRKIINVEHVEMCLRVVKSKKHAPDSTRICII